MSERLTIGSLFSGIGGLELGLERAGLGPVVWQVEKDAYCRAVLAKHWPDALRFDDVLTVGAHNLPPVDVICGGFPCQDISYAGRGAGLAGERSGLWYEFARIIREMGPRFVVVENVAALLDRGMGDVLGTLSDLGYDAEWSCIQACDVGAPHYRDRIFLVAYPARDGWRRGCEEAGWQARGAAQGLRGAESDAHMADSEVVCIGAGFRADQSGEIGGRRSSNGGGAHVQDANRCAIQPRREWWRAAQASSAKWWSAEPDVGRVAHGVPSRLDRLAGIGNAVVPQVAEVVGKVILQLERSVCSCRCLGAATAERDET